MISAKEILLAILFLYISFSIGILLKFIPLKMNFVLTFILSFLTPFLLIFINFQGIKKQIIQKKSRDLWKNFKYDLANIPALIASLGELFAEVYARQVAKRNVYKRHNIENKSTISLGINIISKGFVIVVYNLISSITSVSDYKEKLMKNYYDDFKIKKTL